MLCQAGRWNKHHRSGEEKGGEGRARQTDRLNAQSRCLYFFGFRLFTKVLNYKKYEANKQNKTRLLQCVSPDRVSFLSGYSDLSGIFVVVAAVVWGGERSEFIL